MKIKSKDLKKGEIEISVESSEDLWYLSNIIVPGDMVGAYTIRKIKLNSENDRKPVIIQKKVYLMITAEKMELNLADSVYKILGKIIHSSSEEISLGNYHSFNISLGDNIKIIKKKWFDFQLDLIKESKKLNNIKVLLIAYDRDHATYAEINSSVSVILEIDARDKNITSKSVREKKETKFFFEIVKDAVRLFDQNHYDAVLFGGSGIFYEDIRKELIPHPKLMNSATFGECHSTGKRGILELVKRNEFKQLLKDERVRKEEILVEHLMLNISKESKYSYGEKSVEQAAYAGAVDYLLITTDFVRVASYLSADESKQKFEIMERIFASVQDSKGNIFIVNSDNEAGKKLDSIGGIGAILRYDLKL